VFFQVAGFEPLSEQAGPKWDVCQQPVMVNAVETGGNIGVEDPTGPVAGGQDHKPLSYGIRTTSLFPEPVGVKVGQGFGHGIQGQQM
jgi:hypothetical protein